MQRLFFYNYITITIVIVNLLFSCSKENKASKEAPQNTHPVWSPDGSQIAFISNRVGVENDNPINFEVYTMNADGSNEKRHTFNTAFEADLSWSPDHKFLAMKSYRDQNDEIYILELSTNNQQNISLHKKRDGGTFWDPNTNLLYFQSKRDHEKGELYSYDRATNNLNRITHNDFSENNASWSADGKQIAFVSNMDGDDDIYIMDANGENMKQLTNKTLNDWYPQWSPDGKSVLYTYGDWNTDIFELRIINVDGSGDRTLVKEVDSGNASWHPAGDKIAYGSMKSGKGQIYIYDLKTRQATQITK